MEELDIDPDHVFEDEQNLPIEKVKKIRMLYIRCVIFFSVIVFGNFLKTFDELRRNHYIHMYTCTFRWDQVNLLLYYKHIQ